MGEFARDMGYLIDGGMTEPPALNPDGSLKHAADAPLKGTSR
jgi:hypothetical protein